MRPAVAPSLFNRLLAINRSRFSPLKSSSVLLLVVALGVGAPLRAVDYFVATNGNDNSNGKSATTPFRNLARAASFVNPGDTVTVAPGTYNENPSLVRSGSAAAPIVYRSQTRGAARINGGVSLRASYVDFTGFDVANPNLHGISVVGHHVRLLNNDVHDCSGNGINAFASDYLTIEGSRLFRNGLENSFQASGVNIVQPVAFDQAPGFHLVIRGNQCFDNESRANTRGNNFNFGIGIYLEDFRNTQSGSTAGVYRPATLVENNLLYNNVGRAVVIVRSDNIVVRNNTAWNNLRIRNPTTSVSTLGSFSCQDTDGVRWMNNIVVGRSTPDVVLYDSRTTNTSWDYNILWNGVITIADGSPTVLGANNYVADPRLTAPTTGNFRPATGSLALDGGTSAQAAATDFEGTPRPVGAKVDIGAFETRIDTSGPTNVMPTVAAQPVNQAALTGGIVTLNVLAGGSPPLRYQWSRNDNAISGATNAAFTIPALQPADAGAYTVTITNSNGSVTSAAANVSAAAVPALAWRSPSPEGGSLLAVAFGASRFVAVGVGGRILTSTNGANWSLAATVTSTTLRGIAFDGFQWVTVGDGGGVFTSRDTTTWTQRSAGTNSTLRSVNFINNQFFASGDGGTILTSPDGVSWSARVSGVTQILYGISGTLGRFVAAGQTGTLLTSEDGVTWTKIALTPNTTADFLALAFLNGQFIAVGNSGIIFTSADGVAWTSRSTSTITNGLRSITHNGSQYVITTDSDRVLVTINFATFTSVNIPFNPTSPRWATAFGLGQVVTVGAGGDIASSPDGLTWTQRGANGTRWEHHFAAFLNATWFVIGTNGGVYTSPDAVTWTRQTTSNGNWANGVAYGAGRYVVVADQGVIMTSTDGVAWTGSTTASGTTQNIRNVIFGDGRFVAVTYNGGIITSTNGTTWTAATSGVTTNLHFVSFFQGIFVAVGDSGVILTSTNGTTWTPAPSGTTQALRGIGTDGNTLYIVGGNRTILASTDARTWMPRTVPTLNNSNYRGITRANGGWFVVGDQGVALFSVDGITWSFLPAQAYNETLFGVASNGISTVVVGTGGSILSAGNPTAIPSRLINVATRGLVQPGGTLTPGFVLRGSGTKQVLVRAIGPTLSTFGLNALGDLRLDLVNQQTRATDASNDDWGGSGALANMFASLGAFPLATASGDAAVQARLPVNQGGYSVRIAPSGAGTSGVALAEVYDADNDDAPARLINVSTLGFVGTGENVLTPGFVIRGNVPKLVLIRAVGPGLAPLGVTGVLNDPQFSIFPAGGSTPIVSNNDWGGTASLKAAFTAAAAFSIPDNSRDAAVVVTLPPGGYTMVTSGVGNTTGVALVEIYDLDP